MLQSKTFIGDEYKPPPEVEVRYRRVLDEGVAQRTNLFADAHGQFISGIAPVKTEGGAIVALLQVDYSVSQYLQAIAESTRVAAMIGAAILLILCGVIQYRYLRA